MNSQIQNIELYIIHFAYRFGITGNNCCMVQKSESDTRIQISELLIRD